MVISRRQALGLGAGVGAAAVAGVGAAVEEDALPGRRRIGSLLGMEGSPEPIPTDPAGPVVEGRPFSSSFRPGAPEPWAWSTPPGHDAKGLPVVVALHGYGDDHRFAFDTLGLQHFQARVVSEGHQPFLLASLDGGHSFWHPHEDGVDWARLVSDGLLPEVERLGGDTARLGFIGWSMGGYGSLRLAAEELRGRVKAVGAMSVAVYHELADCPHEGAFDGEANFQQNKLIDRLDRLDGLPVHLATGVNDMYYTIDKWLAGRLSPTPQTMWRKGDHNPNFWRRAAPVQLRFVADHL